MKKYVMRFQQLGIACALVLTGLALPNAASAAPAFSASVDTLAPAFDELFAPPKPAYDAYKRWDALKWPRSREWYQVRNQWCFAGGEHQNANGKLPKGYKSYDEYDVNCYAVRNPPGGRGTERIVVGYRYSTSKKPDCAWYTDVHYDRFQRVGGKC